MLKSLRIISKIAPCALTTPLRVAMLSMIYSLMSWWPCHIGTADATI